VGAPQLEVRRIGRSAYAAAHALQLELLEARIAGEIADTLILTEHHPVITVGRGARISDAGTAGGGGTGVSVVEVERGGEATYHGPGQLVAYPILALPEGRRDLRGYLRDLEEVVIRVLGELEVEGTRRAGMTGVWIGERKVCSIGVAVRRWVTWHGLALNVHTDLAAFAGFRPCGFEPEVMTRLVDHADLPPTTLLTEVLLVKHLCSLFGYELPPPAAPPAPPPAPGGMPELPLFPG
jgi:lipoyl(octanoyl) transferase